MSHSARPIGRQWLRGRSSRLQPPKTAFRGRTLGVGWSALVAGALCVLSALAPAGAQAEVFPAAVFPGVQHVLDAIYLEDASESLLLLDDRLLRFDVESQSVSFIPLPERPLSISELDGEVVIGFEREISRVDLEEGKLGQSFETPVAADQIVLGPTAFFLLHDGEPEGVWSLSREEGTEEVFSALELGEGTTLARGEQGLLLLDRSLYSVGFRPLVANRSGLLEESGCQATYRADASRIWLHGNHAWLDTGHRLILDPADCSLGSWGQPELVTRLPVFEIASLCVQSEYVALVQDPGSPSPFRRSTPAEEAASERGIHVEVFSNPLPKRLAAFPMPSLREEHGRPAWARYVFCDGSKRRLWVVVQNGSWKSGVGTWGITSIDLTPLQDAIERSTAWAELIR